MAAADDRVEINLGDSILVLEGNVIELFHKPSMINRRWHVCHISVDAKPSRRDDVLKYTLGTRLSDVMMAPLPFDVPLSAQPRVAAFFEEAMRRRAASTALGYAS
jgi:hypothetical protein